MEYRKSPLVFSASLNPDAKFLRSISNFTVYEGIFLVYCFFARTINPLVFLVSLSIDTNDLKSSSLSTQ